MGLQGFWTDAVDSVADVMDVPGCYLCGQDWSYGLDVLVLSRDYFSHAHFEALVQPGCTDHNCK